jgi:hypothetical protein
MPLDIAIERGEGRMRDRRCVNVHGRGGEEGAGRLLGDRQGEVDGGDFRFRVSGRASSVHPCAQQITRNRKYTKPAAHYTNLGIIIPTLTPKPRNPEIPKPRHSAYPACCTTWTLTPKKPETPAPNPLHVTSLRTPKTRTPIPRTPEPATDSSNRVILH